MLGDFPVGGTPAMDQGVAYGPQDFDLQDTLFLASIVVFMRFISNVLPNGTPVKKSRLFGVNEKDVFTPPIHPLVRQDVSLAKALLVCEEEEARVAPGQRLARLDQVPHPLSACRHR